MTCEELLAKAKWEIAVQRGTQMQQDYYELLPDWTIYEPKDLKYLKLNIGFALFGPPKEDNLIATSTSDDVYDSYAYTKAQQELIDIIFKKVCEHGKGYKSENNICYSIIYIVVMPTKETISSKELEKTRAKKKNNDVNNTEDQDENNELFMGSIPLFKIKKRIRKGIERIPIKRLHINKKQDNAEYKICYIDPEARVYESWADYLKSNRLPAYTMIVPVCGFYQCNPSLPMSEKESTVWVEVVTSSACNNTNKVLNYVDIGSTVLGAVGVGVGVASLFTPIGPVVAGAGLVTMGATSVWTIGRAGQNLIDRLIHDQSINLNNREAIANWLGVAGAAFTLGTAGTTMFITKMATSGRHISNVARLTHNILISSNVVVNFAGLVYQGYNLYDKYKTDKTIDRIDVILFSTHALFFGCSVVNLQFANELIKTTQGKIIDEYGSNIRSKNLRKKFNRVKKLAAANNADLDGSHAEVVRYINNKKQFTSNPQGASGTVKQAQNAVNFKFGHTEVRGIILSDPIKFAGKLILRFGSVYIAQRGNKELHKIPDHLFSLAREFLQNVQTFFNIQNAPDPSDLGFTLQDIGSTTNSTNIPRLLFSIVKELMMRSDAVKSHIVDLVFYIWMYAKDQLAQWIDRQNREDHLIRVLEVILSLIHELTPELITSFQTYLNGVQLFAD